MPKAKGSYKPKTVHTPILYAEVTVIYFLIRRGENCPCITMAYTPMKLFTEKGAFPSIKLMEGKKLDFRKFS